MVEPAQLKFTIYTLWEHVWIKILKHNLFPGFSGISIVLEVSMDLWLKGEFMSYLTSLHTFLFSQK